MSRLRAPTRRRCALSLAKAISIGGVGREEEEQGASLAQDRGGRGALVDGEVVEDDNVAGAQGGDELGLQPGLECGAVHRPVEHPGGDKAIVAPAGDEGLGARVAEGGLALHPLSEPGAAARARHVGLGAAFVHEDQPAASRACRLGASPPSPRAAPARRPARSAAIKRIRSAHDPPPTTVTHNPSHKGIPAIQPSAQRCNPPCTRPFKGGTLKATVRLATGRSASCSTGRKSRRPGPRSTSNASATSATERAIGTFTDTPMNGSAKPGP